MYSQKMILVCDDWPPYQFNDGSAVKGFAAEIMTTALKDLKQEVSITIYPWKRCLSMIQNKDADGIFMISKTKERESFLIFPDEPVINVGDAFFYLKSKNYKAQKFEDLKGLTIGLIDGFEYSQEVMDDIKNFKQDIVTNDETNFKKLDGGRIDMLLCDKFVGLYLVKKMKLSDKVEFLQRPYNVNPNPDNDLYFAFQRNKKNEALALQFNEKLKAMKKSGELSKIVDKYTK
jgi:polar amino acid transport system substrate-binding protein